MGGVGVSRKIALLGSLLTALLSAGCIKQVGHSSLFEDDEVALQLVSEVLVNSPAPTERRISVFDGLDYRRYHYETSKEIYNVGIGRDANGQVRQVDMVFRAKGGACNQFSHLALAERVVELTEPKIDNLQKRKEALANSMSLFWERKNALSAIPPTRFNDTVYEIYNLGRTCMLRILKGESDDSIWPQVPMPRCDDQVGGVCPEVVEKL